MIFRIKLRWWSSLIATAVMLTAAWGLTPQQFRDDLPQRLIGRFASIPIALGAGVVAGVACMVANYIVHAALHLALGPNYEGSFREFALEVIRRMGPADAVAGGVMAALGEEPLFRGVMLGWFPSPVLGVAVVAVLFGLAHFLSRRYFWFFVWAIGEGVVFGVLMVFTGSILVPVVAHGLFDTVGFAYFIRLRRIN
jgi:hypothetical protein